jgi:prevent-host-death family protein
MNINNIHEAKTNLSKLIEQAENGEEVIIARAGKPIVRLVPYTERPRKKTRLGGQWQGKVRVSKDFDKLPSDIADAFGV